MYPDFSEDVDIPPTSDNTLPMIPELEESDPLPEKCTRCPTAKIIAALEDTLPVGPAPLQEPASGTVPAAAETLCCPRVTLHVHEQIRTLVNSFGLMRIYRCKPTRIPDMGKQQEAYIAPNVTAAREQKKCKIADIIYPYPNVSTFLFNHWFKTGSNKKSDKE